MDFRKFKAADSLPVVDWAKMLGMKPKIFRNACDRMGVAGKHSGENGYLRYLTFEEFRTVAIHTKPGKQLFLDRKL